ncbi:MAG TPA: NIPSNAP family protein [Chryseosolibacter sp.]
MERRDFIQKSILTTAAVAGAGFTASAKNAARDNEIYELRVYHMRRNMAPLDNYLSKALIPALNKAGVKNVGVFSELSKSEPAQIYMLIPYKSFEDYGKIIVDLKKDRDFIDASSEYTKIPQDQAVFERYDSSLLLAFDGHPKLSVPNKSRKLFELRTYEGYSEDAVARKVKMFNSGEIDIFRDVKLNAVFYSENISGKDLPCLTYMAAYDSMEERETVWKAFSAHPEWQKMSKMPEYANTVNKIHKTFLEPVSYSQI